MLFFNFFIITYDLRFSNFALRCIIKHVTTIREIYIIEPESIDIVSLLDLRYKFSGSLKRYLDEKEISDVLILFSAEIDITDYGIVNFFVAMAVTTNFDAPEMIEPFARSLTNDNQKFLFSWVPAHLFGTEYFSIFIEFSEFGEFLVNGLIGEIIREANIEEAVVYLSKN